MGIGGRDLYAAAIGGWGQREGEFGMQVEEELVWTKESYKGMVFKFDRFTT